MIQKIIYISILIFLFSCGSESNEGKGEIVNEVKDEKNPEIKNNKDTSGKILEEEVKDILELKGGIKISYLKHGKGNVLKKGDMVNVEYKTLLPDGKIIDGSDLIGKPLPYFIGINMSIKGWDEVFVNLIPGDKIKLHLPSEKAYGKKGFGTMVPPDTDLDFEIEILDKVAPQTLKGGLKYYHLLKNEKGKATKTGVKVEIHYYGWVFSEGKLFDSSHFNGKTYGFTVGGGEEILCWEEIVKIMHEGDKILMLSPSEMAFAEKGVPELVPPHSKLVYILELMKVL